MKIFLTGGTGFVGTALTRRLTQKGHEVTLLTRTIRTDHPLLEGALYLKGNSTEQGGWQDMLSDHEVIINMAGASIFRRWTRSAKKEIEESRILTTQNLVEALSARENKETLFLSTSAVGYYGFHEDDELDEDSPPGNDFLASLAQRWEASALKAEAFGARVIILRFGVVLGEGGGALRKIVTVFNNYLGGPLGSGEQWFPWIHRQDLANIYLYLMERKEISGPVNCTAPNLVRNREMTKILGEVLGKPAFMPALPGWVIKMALGESGSILLKGQKVLPKRLLRMGFHFRFSEIREALKDLVEV